MKHPRSAIGALALSAAALVGLLTHEGYTDRAVVPVKNDRPTVGFGSTFHADGTPVKMTDKTTPTRALITAAAHISKEEKIFRDSLPGVELSQAEYDVYMDWVYQYGTGAWLSSSMRRELLARNYPKACQGLISFRYMTTDRPTAGWDEYRDKNGRTRWKFDCSRPGNKVCAGVWTRQKDRHDKCMEAQ